MVTAPKEMMSSRRRFRPVVSKSRTQYSRVCHGRSRDGAGSCCLRCHGMLVPEPAQPVGLDAVLDGGDRPERFTQMPPRQRVEFPGSDEQGWLGSGREGGELPAQEQIVDLLERANERVALVLRQNAGLGAPAQPVSGAPAGVAG